MQTLCNSYYYTEMSSRSDEKQMSIAIYKLVLKLNILNKICFYIIMDKNITNKLFLYQFQLN